MFKPVNSLASNPPKSSSLIRPIHEILGDLILSCRSSIKLAMNSSMEAHEAGTRGGDNLPQLAAETVSKSVNGSANRVNVVVSLSTPSGISIQSH